jgi:hypothetical protein
MLSAQVIKQLVTGDCQIPDPALQEIAGKRGFRPHDKLRRFRPASDLPKEGAKPAEILLVRPLLGPYLSDG